MIRFAAEYDLKSIKTWMRGQKWMTVLTLFVKCTEKKKPSRLQSASASEFDGNNSFDLSLTTKKVTVKQLPDAH